MEYRVYCVECLKRVIISMRSWNFRVLHPYVLYSIRSSTTKSFYHWDIVSNTNFQCPERVMLYIGDRSDQVNVCMVENALCFANYLYCKQPNLSHININELLLWFSVNMQTNLDWILVTRYHCMVHGQYKIQQCVKMICETCKVR